MNLPPIQVGELGAATQIGRAQPTAGDGDFAEALVRASAAVLEPEKQAQAAVQQFVAGTQGDLHTAMIALDKAEISLKFMASVRNRVIEAYREIMRMGM